jgi:hypothetical protein
MRELTQTNLDPGNCWQTAIACVLDLDPETMPAQCDYEIRTTYPDGRVTRGPSYNNALQAYLLTHHGLAYHALHMPWAYFDGQLQVKSDTIHFVSGRTNRSATNGEKRHVVVALRPRRSSAVQLLRGSLRGWANRDSILLGRPNVGSELLLPPHSGARLYSPILRIEERASRDS